MFFLKYEHCHPQRASKSLNPTVVYRESALEGGGREGGQQQGPEKSALDGSGAHKVWLMGKGSGS